MDFIYVLIVKNYWTLPEKRRVNESTSDASLITVSYKIKLLRMMKFELEFIRVYLIALVATGSANEA